MIRRHFFLHVTALAALGLGACRPPESDVPAPEVAVVRDVLASDGGMVVSAYPEASVAGAEVLAAGGNAVDAAIATGLALAVTHPAAGNIGGGGFMVIRFPDGSSTAIDFREKAPLRAHPEMFVGEDGEYSYQIHHRSHLAVGVPGTVAGFALAHEKYGNAEWAGLVEPSVALARDGFVVSERLAGSLGRMVDRFRDYPASYAQFSRDGEPYEVGDTLLQADLAATMERIRDEGRDGFYLGMTARLLAEEMERGGGWITEEDLARYEAKEREPVRGTYRGYDVISMPPPSSGGTALVQMLNVLEGFDVAGMGAGNPEVAHHLIEAMRRAFRDRAMFLADSDFADVPVERLTSKAYADEIRPTIQPAAASVSAPADVDAAADWESSETTHYSVVDADGMAVSVTYTLEGGYGSYITVPGAGFLLNNEMGDFNGRPGLTNESGLIGTDANLARPEQRMLSSMTPTILARDGELVAVIGSPGGRTIINTVLHLVVNTVDFALAPADVVAAKRLHHQWLPDRARLENGYMSEADGDVLAAMGHEVGWTGSQGIAHCIFVDGATGELVGVPDPRDSDGAAAGY
ncbi:MAG: gamma-glutamyltransferase [Gemmatimonadetes bacterium]|nr:gamma-glutamyltransferase [Gemmatimonadota bacterium]MYD13853.1 gamma-glutamyltransferase [Gemmatimonadota bacterium]MYI66154.1 gamma-glutamyltransferase [Gemmatimonadota bacterium]